MGGYGSGRFNQNGKSTTNDYPAVLDVRWMQREGLLAPGQTTSLRWSSAGDTVATLLVRAVVDQVKLRRASREGGVSEPEQSIDLDWSQCHLGGQRPWFRCPECNRRVALIYYSDRTACRHCLNLAYASQREKSHVRAMRKADRLRDKLKWGPGVLTPDRSKPKGMHRRTFARLAAEHDQLVREYLTGMTQQFEGLGGVMNGMD